MKAHGLREKLDEQHSSSYLLPASRTAAPVRVPGAARKTAAGKLGRVLQVQGPWALL